MIKRAITIAASGASHVVIATMAGNVISYVFNLLAQRTLAIEDFGHSTASINIIIIIGLISLSVTYTLTKYTARYTHQDKLFLPHFIKRTRANAILLMGAISATLLILSPLITNLFNLPNTVPLVASISLSSGLLVYLSWQRGILAGVKSYSAYATSLVIENSLKLIFIFLPLPLLPLNQFLLAIPFGMTLAIISSHLLFPVLNTNPIKKLETSYSSRQYLLFFIASLYTTACIQILLFTDVLFVKIKFDASQAGMYATLVLVGKIIYFFINSLIAILVPEISHQHALKLSVKRLLLKALSLGLLVGLFLTTAFYYVPELTIYQLLSVEKTAPILNLIPLYGLAVTMISLVIMASTTLLMVGYRFFLPLILLIFFIQGITLIFVVSTIFEVVLSIFILSVCLLALVFIASAVENYLHRHKQFTLARVQILAHRNSK